MAESINTQQAQAFPMKGLLRGRKGIEWDVLIIWIILLVGLAIIIGFIILSGGKMDDIVAKIGDIFRFSS